MTRGAPLPSFNEAEALKPRIPGPPRRQTPAAGKSFNEAEALKPRIRDDQVIDRARNERLQ